MCRPYGASYTSPTESVIPLTHSCDRCGEVIYISTKQSQHEMSNK